MNKRPVGTYKKRSELSAFQIFALSSLTLPIAMGMLAVMMYIPTYYGINLGLGLTQVGIILGIGRLIDVFTDPAIGYFSDQTQSRFGPRKPWIIIGVPALCLALWMLCCPPLEPSNAYLAAAATLYFLSLTFVMVPFGAMALEISRHYHERTVLITTRVGFNLAGSLIAAAVPVAFALALPETLNFLGRAIVITMPVALFFFLAGSPAHSFKDKQSKTKLSVALRDTWRRPHFRRLVAAFACIQIGNTINAALMLLFVTYVLGSPETFGLLLIIVGLSTGLFLPIWYYLSRKIGKYRTWKVSILMCCITLIATLFVGEGDVVLIALCSAAFGAALGCDGIMPASIMADIVYADKEEHKKRLGGSSSGVLSFVTKFAIVVPMGFAFPILGFVGLGETSVATPTQIQTLVILYCAIPIFFRLCGYALIRRAT